MKLYQKINQFFWQVFSVFLIPILILIQLGCPDPPESKPQLADCPVGKSPCIDDSTECCWDTTSHNFVWEIDTLGIYGSYLNDVAIIDENDVWVVGNIETDTATYNAAHWDGNEWVFYSIAPEGFFGPITAVFAFSNNDVWFGKYGLPIHFDGESFVKYSPSNGGHPGQPSIEAIWGTTSSNIYFVGDNGSIVHYEGSTFTKMASGTNTPIVDVWGRDENDIYFCQFNSTTGHSGILHYDGNQLESLYYFESIVHNSDTLSGAIHTIWIYEDTLYAGFSSGIWKENIEHKNI